MEMEYLLLIAGFLLGMLIGVLIMERMYNKHSKEMEKIDVDFEDWKVQRHKQFIAELDEMNSKSHEYWRDEAMKDLKRSKYVSNPNTIDPREFINKDGSKMNIYSPAETDKILRGDWNE